MTLVTVSHASPVFTGQSSTPSLSSVHTTESTIAAVPTAASDSAASSPCSSNRNINSTDYVVVTNDSDEKKNDCINDLAEKKTDGNHDGHANGNNKKSDAQLDSLVLWFVDQPVEKIAAGTWVWCNGNPSLMFKKEADVFTVRSISSRLVDVVNVSELHPFSKRYTEIYHSAVQPLHTGLIVDCLDQYGYWYAAEIVGIDSSTGACTMHFMGWSDRYDEQLSVEEMIHEKKIAPFGSIADLNVSEQMKKGAGQGHPDAQFTATSVPSWFQNVTTEPTIGRAIEFRRLSKSKEWQMGQIVATWKDTDGIVRAIRVFNWQTSSLLWIPYQLCTCVPCADATNKSCCHTVSFRLKEQTASIVQPAIVSTSKPVVQQINQPIDQAAKKPMKQPVVKPVDQSVVEAVKPYVKPVKVQSDVKIKPQSDPVVVQSSEKFTLGGCILLKALLAIAMIAYVWLIYSAISSNLDDRQANLVQRTSMFETTTVDGFVEVAQKLQQLEKQVASLQVQMDTKITQFNFREWVQSTNPVNQIKSWLAGKTVAAILGVVIQLYIYIVLVPVIVFASFGSDYFRKRLIFSSIALIGYLFCIFYFLNPFCPSYNLFACYNLFA